MNKQQPKALRLADTFDHPLPPEWSDMQDAAAELRRLHIEVGQYKAARIGYASEFPVNAEGLPDVENIHRNIRNMKFMRDELLEALKAMVALDEEHCQRCQGDEDVCREVRQARAAIAKAMNGEVK